MHIDRYSYIPNMCTAILGTTKLVPNTNAKGILGIVNVINLVAIPSKPFALIFDFSALLWDKLN